MDAQPSILVVEDDPSAVDLLRFTLQQAGFRPVHVVSGEAALEQVRIATPAAALIDHLLPRMTGLALVRLLRRDPRTASIPLMMVTGVTEEQSCIAALESGADDYVAKPFNPRELVARLRAVIRRRMPERAETSLRVGALRLDPLHRLVTVADRPVPVREVEFSLLRTLMARPDRVFTRDELLDRVWGEAAFVEERTVDVHIRRLRFALGVEYGAMVATVRGRGYMVRSRAPTTP